MTTSAGSEQRAAGSKPLLPAAAKRAARCPLNRAWIIPAGYGAAALLTFGDYGITWDESVQARYGELTLEYFRSGFANTTVNELQNLRFYGPLFELIAAIAYEIVPGSKWEIRHLLIAISALLTIVAAGHLAKLAGADPLIAQLALVCQPQFWGHSFNNSKDIPFACACAWTLVAFARLAESRRWRHTIAAGIAAGAMMAIRPGGVLLLAIAVVIVWWRTGTPACRDRQECLSPIVAGAIAWTLMIAVWPWAHQNPFANPLRAIRETANFPGAYPVLFEGNYVASTELPRRYLAELFAITTPLPILILAMIGLLFAVRRWRSVPHALLAASIVVPMLLVVITRPNLYDGMRHALFFTPFVAVCAAVAAQKIPRRWEGAVILAISISIVPMFRLHPYQSTYFNLVVGGTRSAAGRFDTDYWASSYREAALWLRDHACPRRRTRILVAANAYSVTCLDAYLPRNEFDVARTMALGVEGAVPAPFDYYVATTRWGLGGNYDVTPIVHAVARDGAWFTVIRGRPCR